MMIDFEDGQKPGSTEEPTRLVIDKTKASAKFLTIFDDLLPPHWCHRIYEYSLKKGAPWGVYVPTSDIIDVSNDPEVLWQTDPERSIGLVATRELIFTRGKGFIANDMHKIAGTAIWCLSSGVTNKVEYHVDYAELYRYETNIIYPPLYAATCHLSPFQDGDMVGGDFQVNLGGLDHYMRFGYKGRLRPKEEFEADLQQGADWVTVKYKFNRGIFYDGTLPHMSTPVQSIRASDEIRDTDIGTHSDVSNNISSSSSSSRSNIDSSADCTTRQTKRVILGFNCFPIEVDECCRRAPEHSDAFNRTVKLYQKIASLSTVRQTTTSEDVGSHEQKAANKLDNAVVNTRKGGITAKDLKKNPALAKLLVMAARNMKKHESQQLNAVRSSPESSGTSTK